MERTLIDHHFLVPGADIHDAALVVPITCAILLVFSSRSWEFECGKNGTVCGIADPQFVVIDEVAASTSP